ncbi:MAG: RNA polymerase sigma factor RpoE [Gammaproteobacteria bacterium]|nr:RNA polymerase sigma factor RpoE [Gammaproteobacteria bacterium]
MGEREIDLELVRRVQRGDKTAFDLLVRKYQHKIANLVSRYVGQADVEDVTQEAFIKAYRGLQNFRGESGFYTWMYRIAVNTAKNYLVSSGRRTPDASVDAKEAEQYESGGMLQEEGTPERVLLSSEIERTIQATITELPEELRTAIMLREFEGFSYEEIAATMECPIGTIRSRIFRAREAIELSLMPLLDETGMSDEQRR